MVIKEYLKVKDVEETLRISRKKAYTLVNEKDFPTIRIGKSIRIPQKDFEKWLENNLYKTYEM